MSILIFVAIIGVLIFTVLLLLPKRAEPSGKLEKNDLFTPKSPKLIDELFDGKDNPKRDLDN